jgi:hypothetical protein
VVLGDEAEVIDLDSWRLVHEVRCLGKWDSMPVSPFADVKSLYCTDSIVVVATPGEYRLIPAPCGVSFHVDMLDPRILMVSDIETGEESIYTVFKAFTLDGRYLATYAVEGSEGAELLRGQGPRLLRPRRRWVERPENRRHRLLPIDLRRSRRLAGSRRRGAKPTQRAELHPPNKSTKRRPHRD